MVDARPRYRVLIASYLEAEHVARIRAVDPRLDVVYEPTLLAEPRYPADHKGKPLNRSDAEEARWRELLSSADILFDFDQSHIEDLPDLAANVRWIQATSSGIGQFVRRTGYAERMPEVCFTTARGVHAQPLAEFCLMSMLMFGKKFFRIREDQGRKHWERHAGTDLAGRTLVIVGLGAVGQELARMAAALRMHVVGVKTQVEGLDPAEHHVDELVAVSSWRDVLPRADTLVLIAPHTDASEGLVGAEELARLPRGAVFINIGRGALVDEAALVEALSSGHLSGASLDVFATEPLPTDSPLWAMPNVVVSPHSASTSERENERITDLFCANLRRFLDDGPLENVLDTERLY